jgi:hypothetical protein
VPTIPTVLRGVIRGKIIELDVEPGLADGQAVSVTVAPLPGPETAAEASLPTAPVNGAGQSAQRNQRRIELINKEGDNGLTPEEAAELDHLQVQIDQVLQRDQPLPWGKVRALEECARREGLLTDPPDA